jgi:prolyl oligopeptidase
MRLPVAMLSLAILASQAMAQIPATPSRPVEDRYHGETITDPYRWLETVSDPEVQTWMKAQAAYSKGVLSAIPGRGAFFARMQEVENGTAARVLNVTQVPSGDTFFLRREAGAAQPKLFVRRGLTGEDRVVIDPSVRERKGAFDYFFPSPNGKWVAYGISEGGSERASLYVREVETGKDIAGPFADAMWNGNSSYKWTPDSEGFTFVTLRDPKSFTDKADAFKWMRTWLWRLNAPTAPTLLFDGNAQQGDAGNDKRGFTMTTHESALVLNYGSSPREVALIWDGVRRDVRALARKPGAAQWSPLIGYEDGVGQFAVRGDAIYARSRIGAPRHQVLMTSLSNPDWKTAKPVIAHSVSVVEAVATAKDALYVTLRDGGAFRLIRVQYDTHQAEEIKLPFPGSVRIASANVDVAGVVLEIRGWTQATQFYALGAKDTSPVLATLQPAGKFDVLAGVESRIEMARSHDGVMVPVSIVAKPSAGKLGPVPTAIVAYGAYGISQDPSYRAEWAPWLEAGYVMAVCHVRGGGEYGNEWYEAGKIQTKPNTWKDLIACGEHLLKSGIASSKQLGIMGWSAGGITVGRALTERPDLFAAAAPGVGVLDVLRSESEANGPGNAVEFGTIKKADEFKAMRAMSAYHHVKSGTKYPAVILPHGANDPRVAVWHSSKMAAALQAVDAKGKPVLLNIDYEAGHGPGSSRAQQFNAFADTLAFFLWQFGEKGFQP